MQDNFLCFEHLDWKRLASLPLFSLNLEVRKMLGEALRLMRVFHDCKASDLAKEIDISPSYLSEIEKGEKTPSVEVIKKYANYFKTTPSAVMFFAEDIDGIKPGRSAARKKLIKFMQIIEYATR